MLLADELNLRLIARALAPYLVEFVEARIVSELAWRAAYDAADEETRGAYAVRQLFRGDRL